MTRTQVYAAASQAYRTALEIGMTQEEAEGVSIRVYRALIEEVLNSEEHAAERKAA